MEKTRIGISACLLGEKVRYDGGDRRDLYITDTLGNYFEWFPVCPEVEYGLPVPREPMHLVGEPASPRIVTIRTGVDHTEGMKRWARQKLNELEAETLCGFIFKSRSPSSGISGVKIYNVAGVPVARGAGIFGGAFADRFPLVPIIDDGRLHNPKLRENFIERVFVCRRWKHFLERPNIPELLAFHTKHKLLVMSHSPKHLTELGQLAAGAKHRPLGEVIKEYEKILVEALRLLATVRKNSNVLMHIAGYFRKNLPREDKQELLSLIEQYRFGRLPLIVPVVLLNHYVRKFDEPYLKGQYYLNPHPLELMLRNHV